MLSTLAFLQGHSVMSYDPESFQLFISVPGYLKEGRSESEVLMSKAPSSTIAPRLRVTKNTIARMLAWAMGASSSSHVMIWIRESIASGCIIVPASK